MKRIILLSFALFMAPSLYQNARAQTMKSAQQSPGVRPMAKEGDKVWVFVNHIKADKRQQFEKFIHEVFWPMAQKLSAADQQVFRQTRVLLPAEAEADGTYSYLFIMDPVIEGGDYDIESLLQKMYGKEKAKEYATMLEETEARGQTGYRLVQSRY